MTRTANELKRIIDALVEALRDLRFAPPVTHVYNPAVYARAPLDEYVERYGATPKEAVFVGMNPGPWGMMQTGIPFGEVTSVRDWMGIEAHVGTPTKEHTKRPVQGFGCPRREVSGMRLWGWARDTFETPERFFERFFVANYCPLGFLEASGRNRTPDKLPVAERRPLLAACDMALRRTIEALDPDHVIAVGAFAERRAKVALSGLDVAISRVLHPSPASPAANKGWAERLTADLRNLGVSLS